MNERVAAFRVGIVVIAAAFVTAFLIVLLGEGRTLWRGKYTVFLRFPQAPGVAVDTPVRKQGVLIGRITHIELRDQQGDVVLTARIDAERHLFVKDIPRIQTSSLLGDAVVEFVPSDDPSASGALVKDLDFIGTGIVATDPIRMLTNLEGDVRRVSRSFETAANDVSAFTRQLNETLGSTGDQLPRLMQKTEMALDKLVGTMTTVDQLIGDPELRDKLKQGLADLPVTMEEMRLTMGRARESLDSFESVQQKASRNLENMERFTKPLGDEGPQIVNRLGSILENVDVMTSEIADLAQRLKSSDGSLAKLIRDDELYERVDEIVANFHEASRRLRPIMDDVRVFTDKIARDPRQLGLKGAVERKPLGAGLKDTMPVFRESWSPSPEEE
jgi:phospholipid/cholesterol/gamma-HCH transport system substrate-binding protein